METAGYTTLARQSGLMRELQIVANNIANASTSGFRREAMVFSEHVSRLPGEGSVSMAYGTGRVVDRAQGGLVQTGGTFDLAIQGDAFFLVATPEGERLTRSGAFTPSPDGVLVNADGYALLDAGAAPVPAPVGATTVSISSDGTLSADGQPVAAVGLWQPVEPADLRYQSGTLLQADEWEPAENGTILQGHLEDSNVNPLTEISRMIEVQRAYEMGQQFLQSEDQRQKSVLQTLGK
ncbi:flagellar hook-basal body complex protein [Pseudotabrizicola sp. L79]|uniref:flagellar hook-basal body complex protein n=1 Tax=Pseudotabrizicola sp. L79 TaxID=3118402 RepID=UPI002F95CB33